MVIHIMHVLVLRGILKDNVDIRLPFNLLKQIMFYYFCFSTQTPKFSSLLSFQASQKL